MSTFSRPLSFVFAFVSICCGVAIAAAAEPDLKVGTAIVDVTPQALPVSMTGSFVDRQATGVHDPLNVRCLVLQSGRNRLALLTVDSCLVSRETMDDAKRRAAKAAGIELNSILISATHTHTAVTAVDLASCHADPRYVEFLTACLAQAVVEATENLQPAEIGWGVAQLPGEVFNRRYKMKPGAIPPTPLGRTTDQVRTNPGSTPDVLEHAGPTDPDVMVLAARTLDGKPLALYCVYSLHYVGGIPADQLSADYFGEFAADVRKKLVGDDKESPFVALLANGTSGDINNVDVFHPRPRQEPFEQVKVVAGRTADAAMSVFRSCKFHKHVTLDASDAELELGVRKPSTEELAEAESRLQRSEKKPADTTPDVYAREQFELAKWPDTVPLKLQVLRIGELAIATIPCEAFVEIGLEIKQKSPQKPTFVVGLANGYNGYLPTPRHHDLGGYETWRCRWSYLEKDASVKIVARLLEMLK